VNPKAQIVYAWEMTVTFTHGKQAAAGAAAAAAPGAPKPPAGKPRT